MPNKLLLALAVLSLTACGTEPSKLVHPACPSLPEYDEATRLKAADELEDMPPGSVIADVLIPDYAVMRAGVRACQGGLGGAAP